MREVGGRAARGQGLATDLDMAALRRGRAAAAAAAAAQRLTSWQDATRSGCRRRKRSRPSAALRRPSTGRASSPLPTSRLQASSRRCALHRLSRPPTPRGNLDGAKGVGSGAVRDGGAVDPAPRRTWSPRSVRATPAAAAGGAGTLAVAAVGARTSAVATVALAVALSAGQRHRCRHRQDGRTRRPTFHRRLRRMPRKTRWR